MMAGSKTVASFNIGTRHVGGRHPAFIVAELSGNHLQRFDVAVKTIKAIKESGADAVKFQTYTADTLTIDSRKKYFQIKHGTLWDGDTLHGLYTKAHTPWDWQPRLKKVADDLGLIWFSSAFDKTAVDFLEDLEVPAYKIASFEITDIPLIEYIAKKRKPVILSTGIAGINDIKDAITACRKANNNKIALLKCTSVYPAPPEEMNLNTMVDMAARFGTVVGLSDHTAHGHISIAAAALGAKIIEKHFILDRSLGGPDAIFSLEPREFKDMVNSIRDVEKALGKITYNLSKAVKKSKDFARSLFAVHGIKKGEVFTEANVRSIRPGYGLPPKYLRKICGRRAKRNIEKGTPLTWGLLL